MQLEVRTVPAAQRPHSRPGARWRPWWQRQQEASQQQKAETLEAGVVPLCEGFASSLKS